MYITLQSTLVNELMKVHDSTTHKTPRPRCRSLAVAETFMVLAFRPHRAIKGNKEALQISLRLRVQ